MCSMYQGRELIRSIAMKAFIEKAEESHVIVVGKSLKSRCQVRTDNIREPSLDIGILDKIQKRVSDIIGTDLASQLHFLLTDFFFCYRLKWHI